MLQYPEEVQDALKKIELGLKELEEYNRAVEKEGKERQKYAARIRLQYNPTQTVEIEPDGGQSVDGAPR